MDKGKSKKNIFKMYTACLNHDLKKQRKLFNKFLHLNVKSGCHVSTVLD